MFNLYIDTTDKLSRLILINTSEVIDRHEFTNSSFSENQLLTKVDNLLQKHNLTINSLGALIVNVGPGSFTGTRNGIALANALKLAKPEIKLFEVKNPQDEKHILAVLDNTDLDNLVPVYSTQPSITQPKG